MVAIPGLCLPTPFCSPYPRASSVLWSPAPLLLSHTVRGVSLVKANLRAWCHFALPQSPLEPSLLTRIITVYPGPSPTPTPRTSRRPCSAVGGSADLGGGLECRS